jgi:hypothetical protein
MGLLFLFWYFVAVHLLVWVEEFQGIKVEVVDIHVWCCYFVCGTVSCGK